MFTALLTNDSLPNLPDFDSFIIASLPVSSNAFSTLSGIQVSRTAVAVSVAR